jgi:hypothetical protein
MRSPDDDQMTPEIAGALLAIDATLDGDAVDPEYAGLAELALILRRDPPEPRPEFAVALDERVQRRFARPSAPPRPRGRRWRWLVAPGAAAAAAIAGVAVVIVVAGGNGGISSSGGSFSSSSAAAATAVSRSASAAPAPAARTQKAAAPHATDRPAFSAAPGTSSGSSGSSGSLGSSGSAAAGSAATAGASTTAPAPVPSGTRQIVQSAQIQLAAAPSRIDDVAQQVFDVIGSEKGIVDSSNVTATGNTDGNASFQLSVPSANLSATLTALSRLRGANVVSRTDATADITGQVGGAGERLAVARALRRSLLTQLAAATTTQQVDSIRLQLRSADASINSDLSTLRGLQRQVAYSRIALTIQAAARPAPAPATGSSFTIGRAAHDAGRVLVVVAGVGLIVLAVLVPVGLVAALAAWVAIAVRRRRREQALDLV